MSLSIEATFENGVFIPAVRPDLADHERVRLIVEPIEQKSPTAEEVVERGRRQRIQIDPDLAREIAMSPEFLPEEW